MVSNRHYNNNIYYFIVGQNSFFKMKMTPMTLDTYDTFFTLPLREKFAAPRDYKNSPQGKKKNRAKNAKIFGGLIYNV